MNAFIIIGTRLCNLDNIDDISYEYFQEKRMSIPPSKEPIKVAWDIIIMYKSGNVVTENVVKDEFSTEEEFEVLRKQFEGMWLGLISYLVPLEEVESDETKEADESKETNE